MTEIRVVPDRASHEAGGLHGGGCQLSRSATVVAKGEVKVSVRLDAIEWDTSIQCRAVIDPALVSEYAERMQAGDKFAAIDVFGSAAKCWLGDGWHRVMAARKNGAVMIEANLHPGGRPEALRHALGANALHGHRRTNADKRRCVEIALREFPKLSNVAMGKLCGVDEKTVAAHRPSNPGNSGVEKRTGQDGKERPARREPRVKPESGSKRKVMADAGENDLARALDEAKAWMRRYAHLRPLGPIFDAINDVQRGITR